jgi:pimeloyl-ACP methyl ester carboxylesterase
VLPRVAIACTVACVLAGSLRASADVIELPASAEAVPLIVVLLGDRELAKPAAARWHAAVAKRGWALFAPECPRDLGCKDSFWQWNGDPSWLLDAIAAVKQRHKVERVILIGWSGGASYLGMHIEAWHDVAAIVAHGGGVAPSSTECADGPPVYFLVGDKNPLHELAVALRDHLTGCKREIVWDLVKGADHAHEEAALSAKKAGAILDWAALR